MTARSNACSEITRFWLQTRHGCLVDESIPVPVPYALSDIDLIAMHPKLGQWKLPGGELIGPYVIVETKDEHDWEPTGREFGACLRADAAKMDGGPYIPRGAKGVKFTMLREEHYRRATEIFGTTTFDRLFVVHALDAPTRVDLAPQLAEHGIYWITIRELVGDLIAWYRKHPRPAAVRQSFVGDLFHLLVGFCQLGH